ncbi:MAG: PAS domain S-box protein [Deltaproteobacteria bacterium]|nr:PAS domain S-box protein [Deltaproteobacteria bacterium]
MGNIAVLPTKPAAVPEGSFEDLARENELLRREIREARKAAEITADLVVKQFEETESVLQRFQVANAQRKTVLDSATQISIIATNPKGVITVFNKGAENMLGYRADEVIGHHTLLLLHLKSEMDIRSRLIGKGRKRPLENLDLFFAFAAEDPLGYYEWTYVHKSGKHIPVRMSTNALRGPYGSVEGLLCIALDVSEKKRSEKALMESERKYRILVRNLPNVVYKGYLNGDIDFFDDKIETLTGYSREDFSSRRVNWFDLVHENDLEYAKDIFKQALITDQMYIREYRFKSKNGDVVWVEEGGQIIYGEDGEVEFITGAFLDITERKLAERALHESEKNYRSLFDSGPNPIFVLDKDHFIILDANPSAEETYGYSKEELVGRPFSELGMASEEHFNEKMKLGIARFEESLSACVVSLKEQHFRKNKQPFYVRVTACPTRYHQTQAVIVAVTDINELLEKDAQLAQANKMATLGQMSAGVAHELNQPLNVIKMGSEYMQMMIEKQHGNLQPQLIEVARQVSDQVDRASEIIKLLREFGRKPGYKKEHVNVNTVIEAVLGIIGQQLKLHDIDIVVDLDESIPTIMAQSNRMEQVFFNLLANASDAILKKREASDKAAPQRIEISTRHDREHVVITVSDTGIGIPEENRENIFEPFFTTKEIGKGMGLGLSIIYGIVKEYGGEIEIESVPGKGTSFKHIFPVADSKTPVAAQ